MKNQTYPKSSEDKNQVKRTNLSPELLADLRTRVRELDEAENLGVQVLLRRFKSLSLEALENAEANEQSAPPANPYAVAAAGAKVIDMAEYRNNNAAPTIAAQAPAADSAKKTAEIYSFISDPNLVGMADEARHLADVALSNMPNGGQYHVSEETAA